MAAPAALQFLAVAVLEVVMAVRLAHPPLAMAEEEVAVEQILLTLLWLVVAVLVIQKS
jgi:hypothetical protein